MALDLTPFGEVGKRRGRRRPCAGTRKRGAHEGLDVFDADAALRAGAGHLPDLHAELPRQPPNRRRGWRGRSLERVRRLCALGCSRNGRGPRAAIDVHDFAALPGPGSFVSRRAALRRFGEGLVGRSRPRLPAAAFFGAAGWLRLRRIRRLPGLRLPGALSRSPGVVIEREHHLADLDPIALLDAHLLDGAGHARRHFDRGLVRLELQDRLVLRDRIADGHKHAHHVPRGDVFAQFRECEICWHV